MCSLAGRYVADGEMEEDEEEKEEEEEEEKEEKEEEIGVVKILYVYECIWESRWICCVSK